MRLNHDEFVQHVVDDAVEGARHDYTKPGKQLFLEGAIAGAEACRGKDASAIAALLKEATQRTRAAAAAQDPRYWFHRCYEAEIGWVANVISAALVAIGQPVIAQITARGELKAASILNPPSQVPAP